MPRFTTLLAACAVLSLSAPLYAASPSDPLQRRSAERGTERDSRDSKNSQNSRDSKDSRWKDARDRDWDDYDRMSYFSDDKFKYSPRGKRPNPPCKPTDKPPTNRPPSGEDCRPSKG